MIAVPIPVATVQRTVSAAPSRSRITSLFTALGASPTPMAFPEVFTALQQGTIDGQENPLGTINGNSFHDVQKYLVLTSHVRGNGWMVASERFWQSLAEADRKLLQRYPELLPLYEAWAGPVDED